MPSKLFIMTAWLLAAMSLLPAGCRILNEDCSIRTYCHEDQLWRVDGHAHFSCEEYVEQDCSETGQVCRESGYDDDLSASCYYLEVPCEGERSVCYKGDAYTCDRQNGMARSKKTCDTALQQVCMTYTDYQGTKADCFYDSVSCIIDGGLPPEGTICHDDFAYICEPNAQMADDRLDCRETGRICKQVTGWGAVCTMACEEEGATRCSIDNKLIARCIDGFWIPETECGSQRECLTLEADTSEADAGVTAKPICASKLCPDTTEPNISHCEGNTWIYECGRDKKQTVCTSGCEEIPYREGKVRIHCDTTPVETE